MAGRIQKSDDTFRGRNVVGADVLGNSARFAGRNARAPDGVEQGCLAMINVAHNGHHRRPDFHVGFGMCNCLAEIGFRIVGLCRFRNVTEFADQNHGRFLVEHLIDRYH